MISKKEKLYQKELVALDKRAKARRKSEESQMEWRKHYFATLKTNNKVPLSNQVSANGHLKSIYDTEWKKDSVLPELVEREQKALEEARSRSKAIGIPYNKGAYQVITQSDLINLGKK